MQDLASMRALARKAARMEHSVYALFIKRDGTYGMCKEEEYTTELGKFFELIFY
jgi:hypothetical protein